jgi:hypothetical protein
MSEKRLTGRIARENIRLMQVPRPPQGVVEGFLALGDADRRRVGCNGRARHPLWRGRGAYPQPTIAGSRIVGPALTVRNVPQRIDPLEGARRKVNRMAEFEAHNLATPGDVLVIDGVSGMSNMGGISAQTGKRQGEVGAIVWGGVRDVAHSRSVDYPDVVDRAVRRHRQVAAADDRDQRIDRHRWRAGRAGRSGDRRRDQRLLRAARPHDRRARTRAAKGRSRRAALQGDR